MERPDGTNLRADGLLALCPGVLAAAACVPAAAAASDGDPGVVVETTEPCDQGGAVEDLLDAVEVRLPNHEVEVADSQGRSSSDYRIRWAPDDDSCRLELEYGEATRTMPLAAESDETAIREAASRIAWFVATDGGQRLMASPGKVPPESNGPLPPASEVAPADREGATRSEEETEAEEREGEARESERGSEEASDASDREADESSATRSEESGENEEQTSSESSAERPKTTESEGPVGRPADTSSDSTERNLQPYEEVPYRLTLLPLLSVPRTAAERVAPAYALNLVGMQYGVVGVEVGLLANIDSGFVRGYQAASVLNFSGGPASGLQTAFGGNLNLGPTSGASLALGFNGSGGELAGLQAAIGGNVAADDVAGAQLAAGFNWVSGDVEGVQGAGANVARDVDGVQMGLLNVGREVSGLQLGLLNIAKTSDVSLGALNINYDRPLRVAVRGDELGFGFVELQHGSEHLRNVFVLGMSPIGTTLGAAGAGLGGHFPIGPLYLDLDLLGMFVAPVDQRAAEVRAGWGQLRLTLGWSVAERFAIFGAGTFNLLASSGGGGRLELPDAVPGIRPNDVTWLWPGLQLGVRF